MNSEQRVARNRRLVRDRLERGVPWKVLARDYDVTERGARYIVRTFLQRGEGMEHAYDEPTKVVDELLAGYRTDLWELNEAVELAWGQRNATALVGGVKARMDARQRIIELLQATNRLPKNLGHLSVIYDVRFLVEQVVEVFDEHDVPPEARRALLDRLGPVIEGDPASR